MNAKACREYQPVGQIISREAHAKRLNLCAPRSLDRLVLCSLHIYVTLHLQEGFEVPNEEEGALLDEEEETF